MTPTGRGKNEKRVSPPSLLLFNFDIDGHALKPEHKAFLQAEAITRLRAGSSVRVIGLADRKGGAALHAHNQVLSEKRVASTVAFLRSEVPGLKLNQATGFGEDAAAREGEAAGSSDEHFRSVLVFIESAAVVTKTKVIEITAKSFIAHIGTAVGTMPGTTIVPVPLPPVVAPVPVSRQFLLERLASALELNENPLNAAKDGQYRLFSRCRLTVVFEAGIILAAVPGIPDLDSDVGLEGPIRPPPLIVSPVTVSPKGGSFVTFSWFAKGKPHPSAEILFNSVQSRTSVFIWHEISGKIDVSSGTPVVTVSIEGSKFPSHRVFRDGTLVIPELRQGPFSNLWVPHPSDRTRVR